MSIASENLIQNFITGYGLIELPFEQTIKGIKNMDLVKSRLLERKKISASSVALKFLADFFNFPATRHVFFPINTKWTAVINNNLHGSDFADYQLHFSKKLHATTIRIVDRKSRIEKSKHNDLIVRMSYEARIFQMRDKEGKIIKNIYCMDDGGKWDFKNEGVKFPIENEFHDKAKKKKDRFTSLNLEAILRYIGVPLLTPIIFQNAGKYSLVEEKYSINWQKIIQENACTLEEKEDPAYGYYKRGLRYVPHMETHASSVVHDFEKAIALNPNYEPKVRKYLEKAKKNAQFQ